MIDFETCIEQLDSLTDKLEASLASEGWSVGGESCIPGWNKFIDNCENIMIDEHEGGYLENQRDLSDFLDSVVVDAYYMFLEDLENQMD